MEKRIDEIYVDIDLTLERLLSLVVAEQILIDFESTERGREVSNNIMNTNKNLLYLKDNIETMSSKEVENYIKEYIHQ